jgi:hypothetical protein
MGKSLAKKDKRNLSQLPLKYQRQGKGWWINTKTGYLIPDHKITEYLPVPPPDHEVIISKRYDLNY